jgi:branched-chain amino acid transport system substrate-binding protein
VRLQPIPRRHALRLCAAAALGSLALSACQPAPPGPTPTPTSDAPPVPLSQQIAPPAIPPSGHVKIGLIAPFSGVYRNIGPAMHDAFTRALSDFGSSQQSIDVARADETPDVPTAMNNLHDLVERQHATVLTGFFSTTTAYAAHSYVRDRQLVTVAAVAGGGQLTDTLKSPFLFQAGSSVTQLGHPAGTWAAANLGHRAVTVTPDDDYGRELGAAFMEAFRAGGGEIVGNLQPKAATPDYGPFLPQLVAAKPELVFVFAAGLDAATFTKQFDQFGAKNDVHLFGTGDFVAEDTLTDSRQAALGAKSVAGWAWGIDNPANKQLINTFFSAYKHRLNEYAVQQYDATRLLLAGLDAVQWDVSDPGALVRAIEAVHLDSARGPLTVDPITHGLVQNVYIREVREASGELHNLVLDTFQNVPAAA